jgi:hypothetical protein
VLSPGGYAGLLNGLEQLGCYATCGGDGARLGVRITCTAKLVAEMNCIVECKVSNRVPPITCNSLR